MDKLLADLEEEKAKRDKPNSPSVISQSPKAMTPIDSSHVPVSMSATTLSGMSELRNDILDDPEIGIPQLEVVGIYLITCINNLLPFVVFINCRKLQSLEISRLNVAIILSNSNLFCF